MGRGIRGERNLGPNQNASRRAWQAGVVFGSLKLMGPTSLGASSRPKVEAGSTVVDVPARAGSGGKNTLGRGTVEEAVGILRVKMESLLE
jgi:hypothetical protein